MPENPMRAIYRNCDPTLPLTADDARHVEFHDAWGIGDLMARLTNAIFFDPTPQHFLFTGHRGGGKSTELLHLKKRLSNLPGDERFFVVYFEADQEDIDVNDVDFPDLLLAMIRHLGKELRERLDIRLTPPRIVTFLEEVKGLLGSDVEFEKAEFDAKIAKFTASIKSSPNARLKIRKALEPNVSNLIVAANELLKEAQDQLRDKGFQQIVLIVDNLDRIVLREIANSRYNTHEQLFINRGNQLTQLQCHIFYTLPVSLALSNAPALRTVYSRPPDILPMVRVCDRNGDEVAVGMERMREVIYARLRAAEVADAVAFDSIDTLNHLCRTSGGHVRDLLILLRSACEWAGELPITRASVDEAIRMWSNGFDDALNRPEYLPVLREIDRTQVLQGNKHEQWLLHNLSILHYNDGSSYYRVSPAVQPRLQASGVASMLHPEQQES